MTLQEINQRIKETQPQSIGTQKEKTLHKVTKYLINEDSLTHEVKTKTYIVDCFYNEHAYEIQTQNFGAFRDKIETLLHDYSITVCYPLPMKKNLITVDPNGEIISQRASSHKAHPLILYFEAYKIKMLLRNPKLDFIVFCFSVDEFKTPSKVRRNRKSKLHIFPKELLKTYYFPKDIPQVFPLLPEPFDSKVFAKAIKVSRSAGQTILNVLTHIGFLLRVGKTANSILYEVNKNALTENCFINSVDNKTML